MSRSHSYTIPLIEEFILLVTALMVYLCVSNFGRGYLILLLSLIELYLFLRKMFHKRLLLLILAGLICMTFLPEREFDLVPFSENGPSVMLEMTLKEDSVYIKNHQKMLTGDVFMILLPDQEIRNTGSYGQLKVLTRGNCEYYWGERIRFEISGVSEGICFISSLERVGDEIPRLLEFRRGVIRIILERLSQLPYGESQLGRLLLLGESADPDLPLINQITGSGARHLIALSGMHLYVLGLCIGLLTQKLLPESAAKILTMIFILLFIFIAGFRASLIRAGILFCISRLCREQSLQESLLITWYLHLMLFPSHGESFGFLLSYAAIYGIIMGFIDLSDHIPCRALASLLSLFSASLAATVMTLPLIFAMFGVWYPVGLVASLLLTPLIMAYMGSSFVILIIPIPDEVLRLLFYLTDQLSLWFSKFPSIDGSHLRIPPYPVTILLLTAIRFIAIYGRIFQNRREEEAYEQSISLRFTKGNTEITRE